VAGAGVTGQQRTRGQLDLLLIVRGLAALAVVYWHVEGYKAQLPHAINTSGRMAVWMFFGISGYVIAYGFLTGRYRIATADLSCFYRNRFLRIYPLFLILSLLAWMTEWTVTGISPLSRGDMPAEFLAWQWTQTYALLGVFWTLGVELHFYLLAPLLIMPFLLPGRWWALGAAAMYAGIVAWCEYAARHYGWSWDGRNIVSNLPHFVAGMAACRYSLGRRSGHTGRAAVLLALAVVLLGGINWLYHATPGTFWSMRGLLLADVLIVLTVMAHAEMAGWTAPAWIGPLTMLGTLSYGIYAWHAYLMKYVPWTADRVVALSLLSIAIAYVSYRVVERPALRQKRHPALSPRPRLTEPAVA
jgi:peptidoglycan/LPS O-acetylase OafA/YrhL